MPTPLHLLADTWPNDGQAYDAIRMAVTDNNGGLSNSLLKLLRNNQVALSVGHDGRIISASSISAAGGISPGRLTTSQRLSLSVGANDAMLVFDTSLSAMFLWTGSSWVRVSSDNDLQQSKHNHSAGIAFPISTSRATGRLTAGTLVDENPGSGPLTLWWRGQLPSSFATSAGICGFGPDSANLLGGSGMVAFALAVIGGDVQLIMGNSTTRTQYALSMAGLAGQVANIVVTRSGLTLAAYVNGVAVTLTPVNTGAGFAADATINGDFYHAGAPLSASISGANNVVAGPCQRFVLFNRALSAADASSLIVNGVDVSDRWGSKAEIMNATTLNGGFETAGAGGADVFANWTESPSGTTINRDTSVFFSGAASLRFDVDGSGSYAAVYQNVLEVGKRYRVTAAFRHNAASSISPQINLDATQLSWNSVTPNTWVTQSADGVATGANLFVNRRAGAPSTSHWYDDIIVQRVGAIVDLQFDGTCGFMAADRANRRDAVLFSGAAFTLPDATRGFARWIASAPAGERMGGSAGIVIPTDASISRIIAHNLNVGPGQTISIGSGSGANINNMAANVPLNGTGQITVIDPANSTSPTGQLWISYTGTGSVLVTAIFERF